MFPNRWDAEQLDKLKLETGIVFETQYDPAKLWDGARKKFVSQGLVDRSPYGLYYDGSGAATGTNVLPRETPYPGGPFPGNHKLLSFFPDGTASANVTLLIRDEQRFRWVLVWKGGIIRNGDLTNSSDFQNQIK